MPDTQLLQDASIVVFNEASVVEGQNNKLIIQLNPNNTISGMQFDMVVDPDIISPSSINAGGSPAGFAADMNQLSSGAYRILLFNAGNDASIPVNSDTVMTIHFTSIGKQKTNGGLYPTWPQGLR